MSKKRKFTSVDDKCRVCLQDDGCMSYIFSEDIKPKFTEFADAATIKVRFLFFFLLFLLLHIKLDKCMFHYFFGVRLVSTNILFRRAVVI